MAESNDSKAVKSGIWYILVNFLTRGIGFLTMPLFVRLMTKEETGQYVNLTTWIALLTPVLTLNLNASVPVAKYDYRQKINDYITSVLVLGSLVTAVFYAASIIFEGTIKGFLKFDSLQLHIMFIYMLVSPALLMLQVKCRLDYKYILSTVLSLLSAGVCTLIALAAVFLSSDKLQGRILGLYVPTILLNVGIYVFFLTQSRTVKTEYWKYGLKICIPLVFHALAGSLLSSFDRIMINSMVGNSETALYTIAYTCAAVVDLLWYSLNQAWAPWAYEQMDLNKAERLKKASKVYLFLFGLIVLAFMLIAPELLWFMGGSAYSTALNVIPPVMCGFEFQLVYSLYVNIETLEKKTGYVAIGTITAAAANIILNLIFIPRFGYVAAAYTTLAGYAVLFLMHFFFVHQIRKAYWYDSKFNFIYLLTFATMPMLMTFVYNFNILRYLIIAAIIAFFAIKMFKAKAELINAIKEHSWKNVLNTIIKAFTQ